MNYIADIIFLAVFALVVFLSKQKGFFSSLFDFAAYVISLVSAKLLSTMFAPELYSSNFEEPIRTKIVSSLGSVATTDYSAQVENTLKQLPESVSGVMTLLGIDRDMLVEKVSQVDASGAKFIDYLMKDIVSPVATAVIRTVLFVVIAFVLSILLKVIIAFLKKSIDKMPKLKQVDSSLGFVVGIFKGTIIVFIIALLLGVVAGFIGNEQFVTSVNNSIVVKAVKGFLDSVSGYVV